MNESTPQWQDLIGQQVVVDLHAPFVYTGTFAGQQGDFLLLEGVDAHDLRDGHSTREKYVLDLRRLGVQPNRAWLWVHLREIVGISRLADVIEY